MCGSNWRVKKKNSLVEVIIVYERVLFTWNYVTTKPDIGIRVRVFTIGSEDRGSIPGRVIPKTLKIVLDAVLLNTQHKC